MFFLAYPSNFFEKTRVERATLWWIDRVWYASWQRCRVHFMRNVLARIPHKDKKAVAEAVRLIFDQPSLQSAQDQLRQLVDRMNPIYPKAATCCWKRNPIFWLTNLSQKNIGGISIQQTWLRDSNKEIKRRTKVVDVFPDQPAVIRLTGTLLIEIDDDWRATQRRYFSRESMHLMIDSKRFHKKEKSFFVDLATPVYSET
jgi:transposase-like protein